MNLVNLSGNEEIEQEIGNVNNDTRITKELAQFVSEKLGKPVILIVDSGGLTSMCCWSEDDNIGSQLGKISSLINAAINLAEAGKHDVIDMFIFLGSLIEPRR